MSNVERKFSQWSKKLYDISKRNYMINFTGQKRRSVKITSPSMEKLYDLLVVNEKSLTFKRNISRDNNFYVFAVSTLLNSLGSNMSFKEGDIEISAYKDKDPYDVLRNIKRVSNMFKLEQGIDVLHITFGYVRWKVEDTDDYYITPLINMPVILEQETINSLYTVSKVSEPELNPIFKYMVEKQGVKLPELNDKPINEYLKEIDEIANLNGWEVIYESSLCILFFQKMVMFKDLENNKDKIINHPLIKAFCDESDEYFNESNLVFDHDIEKENNRLLVVEADSSQMDALTLARQGKSFVLQGPPGTGKSQTITNIIAQAMGQGKKVLFVSSKTAALEVVYNKLKQANLDDFVLALHNIKSNKAKVVNDVYAPYLLKKIVVKEEKLFELERMQSLKQEINKYAKTINKKVYQLDMNFYDVVNEYYKYNDFEYGEFFIPNVSEVSKSKLNQILSEIRLYESKCEEYKQKFHSCYDFTTLKSLSFDEKEMLEHNLKKAYENISLVIDNIDNINYYISDFYVNFAESYQAISDLSKALNSFFIRNYSSLASKYELDENRLNESINKHKSSLKKEVSMFISNYTKAINSYRFLKSMFTEEKKLDNYSNEELLNLIKDCYDNIASLKSRLSYEESNKSYNNNPQLADFIRYTKENNVTNDLVNIYLKKFYSKVILSFIYDNEFLSMLQKAELEGKIKEFDNLCKEQHEISKAVIRSRCLEKVPTLKTNLASNDERSYLVREYQKARKQSVRKLFDNIPHLMLDLKPCLMMSPLTVSNYLANDNYTFDMVVFDEASQIRPEEAINSIYRAKQVIIAGDSKQLPPTNFFSKKEDDIDEDEEDEIILESMDESILEYANRKLPSITLLWHYRSKNENLIDFSNKNFYASDLITFPSVMKKDEDFGVEYLYVNGIYNKGSKIANEIEAERVIDLIDEHIEKYGTERSLGVIAFGERQRNTIEKALIKYRKEKIDDKRYEAFFSNELKEPFFVKNIESVQGDERDTIIFSIGYGKDANGVFRYNFGPLQTQGGERRLNVAISRAKLNLKVVASFTPDEIDLSRIESVGVRLFKHYLTFAYNTSLNNIENNNNQEIGIKTKIANYIKSLGFDVILDYGYSSFKIDIAVIDKNDPNRFVAGILLDNQIYLNEKTCKDREILKKEILTNNGWKILRVYSKFYIENEALENKTIYKFITGNKENAITEVNASLLDYADEISTSSIETIDYGFDTFIPFDYSSYLDNNLSVEGTLFAINDQLVDDILQTVCVIHLNELIKQIADAFKVGESRAKNRVLRIINDGRYERDRMFIYLKGYDPSIVKKVTGDYKRTLEYIHPAEVKNCLLTILSNAIGLTRDGLIREAMIIFGVRNKSSRVNDFFNVHINRLLGDNLISETDRTLAIKEGSNNG